MKNITLSIPEDLLKKSREYAKKQGTTLNQMVRDLLKKSVEKPSGLSEIPLGEYGLETKGFTFNRDELYER